MTDHSRILLAIAGLAIGPALAAMSSYLLGNARAVARHAATERRRMADLGQYAAALLALTGFLVLAGGAGLLVSALVPGTATVQLVGGAVTGVLVFTIAGMLFSRLADAAEDSRVRRMPAPAYAPARALPALPAAATAAPTGASATQPPDAPPPALAPTAPVPTPPITAQRTPLEAAPSTSAQTMAAYAAPEAPAVTAEAPAARAAIPLPASSTSTWFDPIPEPGDDDAFRAPQEADGAAAESSGEEQPVGPEVIEGPEQLAEQVRPGWIYRDSADSWYLGVGSDSGALLRLPEFGLAPATEPQYPLVIVGAGEIAVVPVDADAPAEHLTD